jgi:hypothetical protein
MDGRPHPKRPFVRAHGNMACIGNCTAPSPPMHRRREHIMSIFSTILSKIFPPDHPANTTPAGGGSGPGSSPSAAPEQSAASAASTPAGTGPSSATSGASAGAQAPVPQSVDVYAVLSGLQANRAEQLNWQTSIVDLLKLLDLDSSLTARKELATELHYTESMDDTAAMNVWLHKEVMLKLAENGGNVPNELRA